MSRAQLTAGVVPASMPACRSRANLCGFGCAGAAACAGLSTTPNREIANSAAGSRILAMHAAHRRTPTAGRVSLGAARFIAATGCCEGILPALVVVMVLAWSGDSVEGHADASLVPIHSHRFIDWLQNVAAIGARNLRPPSQRLHSAMKRRIAAAPRAQ